MNRKVSFHLLFCLALLIHAACTRVAGPAKPDEELPAAVTDTTELVLRIRQTSRLYTAEYLVHKIITHSDAKTMRATLLGRDYDMTLPLGDRKVAIPLEVTLQAYIDFSGFSARQIERSADGRHLHVTLPDPKVVVTASRVDHESVRQFTDLLRSEYSDEEMAALTEQGVRSVLQQVPELGIVETARDNAAAVLIPMLAQMGYDREHVVITFREEFTEQDLPFYTDSPPALPVREGANTFKK